MHQLCALEKNLEFVFSLFPPDLHVMRRPSGDSLAEVEPKVVVERNLFLAVVEQSRYLVVVEQQLCCGCASAHTLDFVGKGYESSFL